MYKRSLNGFNDSQAYKSKSEPYSQFSAMDKRSADDVPRRRLGSEKWFLELQRELDRQGISLPERIDRDELCRFYAAADFEFSRLLSSIMKTIRWRQTYSILSPEELEAWFPLVFWRGFDVKKRHCLVVRLGLACSNLRSNERPLFVKAVGKHLFSTSLNHFYNGQYSFPQRLVLYFCKIINHSDLAS
ncbi:hypothetical protein LguiA_034974 [Lonicera macranthoides]